MVGVAARKGGGMSGIKRPSGAFRMVMIGVTVLFAALFLVLPLITIFYQAFWKGWTSYAAAIANHNSLHAVMMTLLMAACAVVLNTVFGIAAAWGIAKFEFRGKTLLTTVLDLPFAVSPVVAGLCLVLLFGRQGLVGPWLLGHHVRVIFALPGMVLATVFVTFPFVARELIPLMQEQGSQEEQAALSLGASAWQMFWRVTLPNIKWALLYGVILCNARAMGEFGALSVVTQPMQGQTNTLPLEIEYLYNSYGGLGMEGAFALSTLLAMLGLVTLAARALLEWKMARELGAAAREGE